MQDDGLTVNDITGSEPRAVADAKVRADVEKQIKQELADARRVLKENQRLEREVQREAGRLSESYWRLAKKVGYDNGPTDEENAACDKADRAYARMRTVWVQVRKSEERIAKLSDPGEIEARVQDLIAVRDGTPLARGRATMSKNAKTPKVEVPSKVVDRIVNEMVASHDVTYQDIADKLNKDGVTGPTGKDWNRRQVQRTFLDATQGKYLSELRGPKPALKDRPPAATKALPKKNGNGDGEQAETKSEPKTGNGKTATAKPNGNGKAKAEPKSASKSAAAKPAAKRTAKPDPKPASTRKSTGRKVTSRK